MRRELLSAAWWLIAVLAGGAVVAGLPPEAGLPQRPNSRTVILDEAAMIADSDWHRIQEILEATLTETAIPIVVVTIPSMRHYGASVGTSIEEYARLLFDSWGIGHKSIRVGEQEVSRNLGVLLLVSKGDRKARIELGADWGHAKDADCQEIMQDHIIASFKREEFSKGILAGVEALSYMVREQELPSPPRPWWHYGLVVGAAFLFVFTVVSLIRRGASGWAWLFWGFVFTVVGVVLYYALKTRARGGGFSGGSFGGGFSGGGGATGSW